MAYYAISVGLVGKRGQWLVLLVRVAGNGGPAAGPPGGGDHQPVLSRRKWPGSVAAVLLVRTKLFCSGTFRSALY